MPSSDDKTRWTRAAALGSLLLAASVPVAAAPSASLASLIASHGLKRDIAKPPRGLLGHPYIVPAGPYFQLFDWDMYFMSVALSYDKVSKPVIGSVEDFLDFVDEFADAEGYTPREIAPDALWALPEMCKPFLAQAAVRASLTAGDVSWLLKRGEPPSAAGPGRKARAQANLAATHRTYYEKLADTLAFWEEDRRAPDGLFVWYNGVESGTDNSPAVSDAPAQTTEGVDLQCYLYREYLAMAFLARRLGKTADAAAYEAKAASLASLARRRLWSEADGGYRNIDSRTGTFVKAKAWTDFTPLWAGLATPEQAKRMVEGSLLDPARFWSAHGVRTLSKDEPLYDPRAGYWRGPVWVVSDYLVMHGLMNYGYKAQARELAEKTASLLAADIRRTGGMNENYDPETGAPDASGHFVSWNLLAARMVEEAETGTDPTAIPAR